MRKQGLSVLVHLLLQQVLRAARGDRPCARRQRAHLLQQLGTTVSKKGRQQHVEAALAGHCCAQEQCRFLVVMMCVWWGCTPS